LPLPGKTDEALVWPDHHSAFFNSLEGRATKVDVLGWRGMDGHFTPLLSRAARPDCTLLIANGGDDMESARVEAQNIEERMAALGARDGARRTPAEMRHTGFTTFTQSGHSRTFLEQQ
jgi:hypothetical protein